MGLENYEDAIGQIVTVKASYGQFPNAISIEQKCKITGIVDVSMFETMLVAYLDYDYFDSMVTANGGTLSPTSLYIQTDSEATTDTINLILSGMQGYTGSVENQMASMFTEMLSTFSSHLQSSQEFHLSWQ